MIYIMTFLLYFKLKFKCLNKYNNYFMPNISDKSKTNPQWTNIYAVHYGPFKKILSYTIL